MSKNTAKTATAKDIRAWFTANPSKVDESFSTSLKPNARGRLHPKAVEVFQAATKQSYTKSTTAERFITLQATKVNAAGAKRAVTLKVSAAEVRAFLGAEGKRGRLSSEGLAKAGQHFVAQGVATQPAPKAASKASKPAAGTSKPKADKSTKPSASVSKPAVQPEAEVTPETAPVQDNTNE
jgi:hypothetical protein